MSQPAVRHPGEFRWETRLLAVATLALTVIGIASCYASSTYLPDAYRQATQQGVAALIGGVVFLLVAQVDYQWWRKLALPAFLVTLAALVVLAMVALRWPGRPAPGAIQTLFPFVKGAHRWVQLGVRVQPSEVARVTLVAWLAAYAAQLGKKVRDLRGGFLPMIGVLALTVLLVRVEPSVSMAIALAIVGGAVLLTAGARVPHLVVVAIVGVAAVLVILKVDPLRHRREEVFQTPSLQCGTGDQSCQSLIGIGNGGVFGVGYERGTQKLGHIPEVYSDFLLSVVGEEWGFVGVSFVGLCFFVFCWMGFRIARTASDPFGTYLASGLTVSVGIVACMHAAVVLRLMPTTGLTLPFMSVGRVSLILYLFSAGVLVSIGRRRGRPARVT